MADTTTADRSHGRQADTPRQIPAPGWKQIAIRSWQEVSANNIFLVSGGVTYAILLALFPGLAALVSVYGLLFDPGQIQQQIDQLAGLLPKETQDLLDQQMHQLVSAPHGALSFAAVLALVLALWSASRGMSGLMSAMNIAYEEKESRGFLRFNSIALTLTFCAVIGGLLAIALVGVLPATVQILGLSAISKWLLLILEWPMLLVIVLLGMAVLYRYGPNRTEPQWRWVSPGAITGTILWIAGSIAFSVYVAHFNSYNKTYGSLGGAVILLTWLYLSSFVLLLGAVINAQSERQTARDTTRGQPEPMGRRGAHAADTLG